MTARDGIGVAVGASLSFSLGLLATEKHPEHVLRWGLGISLAVLAGLWLWEMARGPWISVHVTPGKTVPDGVVLNIGLKNNGSRAADQKIFNLLVPDRFPMFESFENGDQRSNVPPLLHAPESVDGISESHYWNRALALAPGTLMVYVRIGCGTDEFVMRANIGD